MSGLFYGLRQVGPINLNKWEELAVLTAEDLVEEFQNIYNALNTGLTPSKPSQTQEEYPLVLDARPNAEGIYPVEITHWEEHLHLRWAIVQRGDAKHWFEVPSKGEIVRDRVLVELQHADDVGAAPFFTALKYSFKWAGSQPGEFYFETEQHNEVFSYPAGVIFQNGNLSAALTIQVRVGNGDTSRLVPIHLASGVTEAYGVGGGFDPVSLSITSEVHYAEEAGHALTSDLCIDLNRDAPDTHPHLLDFINTKSKPAMAVLADKAKDIDGTSHSNLDTIIKSTRVAQADWSKASEASDTAKDIASGGTYTELKKIVKTVKVDTAVRADVAVSADTATTAADIDRTSQHTVLKEWLEAGSPPNVIVARATYAGTAGAASTARDIEGSSHSILDGIIKRTNVDTAQDIFDGGTHTGLDKYLATKPIGLADAAKDIATHLSPPVPYPHPVLDGIITAALAAGTAKDAGDITSTGAHSVLKAWLEATTPPNALIGKARLALEAEDIASTGVHDHLNSIISNSTVNYARDVTGSAHGTLDGIIKVTNVDTAHDIDSSGTHPVLDAYLSTKPIGTADKAKDITTQYPHPVLDGVITAALAAGTVKRANTAGTADDITGGIVPHTKLDSIVAGAIVSAFDTGTIAYAKDITGGTDKHPILKAWLEETTVPNVIVGRATYAHAAAQAELSDFTSRANFAKDITSDDADKHPILKAWLENTSPNVIVAKAAYAGATATAQDIFDGGTHPNLDKYLAGKPFGTAELAKDITDNVVDTHPKLKAWLEATSPSKVTVGSARFALEAEDISTGNHDHLNSIISNSTVNYARDITGLAHGTLDGIIKATNVNTAQDIFDGGIHANLRKYLDVQTNCIWGIAVDSGIGRAKKAAPIYEILSQKIYGKDIEITFEGDNKTPLFDFNVEESAYDKGYSFLVLFYGRDPALLKIWHKDTPTSAGEYKTARLSAPNYLYMITVGWAAKTPKEFLVSPFRICPLADAIGPLVQNTTLYEQLYYDIAPGSASGQAQDKRAYIYRIKPYSGDIYPTVSLRRADGSPLFDLAAFFIVESQDPRGITFYLYDQAGVSTPRRVDMPPTIVGKSNIVLIIVHPESPAVILNFGEVANTRIGYNEIVNSVVADRQPTVPTSCAIINPVYGYGGGEEISQYPYPSVDDPRSRGAALYDDPALTCFVGAGLDSRINEAPDFSKPFNTVDIRLHKDQQVPYRLSVGSDPLMVGVMGGTYDPTKPTVVNLGSLVPPTKACFIFPRDFMTTTGTDFSPVPRACMYVVPPDLHVGDGNDEEIIIYLYRDPRVDGVGPQPAFHWLPLYDNAGTIYLKNESLYDIVFVNGKTIHGARVVVPGRSWCSCVIGNAEHVELSFVKITGGLLQ